MAGETYVLCADVIVMGDVKGDASNGKGWSFRVEMTPASGGYTSSTGVLLTKAMDDEIEGGLMYLWTEVDHSQNLIAMNGGINQAEGTGLIQQRGSSENIFVFSESGDISLDLVLDESNVDIEGTGTADASLTFSASLQETSIVESQGCQAAPSMAVRIGLHASHNQSVN